MKEQQQREDFESFVLILVLIFVFVYSLRTYKFARKLL